MSLVFPVSASAKSDDAHIDTPDRAALMGLARQFVGNIGQKLKKLEQEQFPEDPLVRIADGESLIFQFRLNEKTMLEGDTIAVKQGRELLVSFRDFLDVLYFPIEFDAESKNAKGWYIREEKNFSLDWPSRRVETDQAGFDIPESVIEEADDILVPLDVLAAWFGLHLKPDVEYLMIDMTSDEPLPIEGRMARRGRGDPGDGIPPEAKLPRVEDPYLTAETPVLDVSVVGRYRRPPKTAAGSAETTKIATTTLQGAGDVAGHTGEVFVTADSKDRLRNIRAALSKDSEDPVLLGPLKARRYEAGDVTVTNMPIFNSGGQELGARVTNKESGRSTSFTTTEFFGNLPPQWDVELYRDSQLVGFVTVEDDGRYEFRDVALFEGDNDFRFVFYGPQGEVREELKSVPVDLAELREGGNYDVSVSLQETETYSDIKNRSPERGDLSVSATYEKALGGGLVGIVGARQRSFGEEQKTQLLTGLSANVADTLINTNLGVDAEGGVGLQTNARRKFGEHRASLGTYLATDTFSPNTESDSPTVFSTKLNLEGPLFEIDNRDVNYGFTGEYNQNANGEDLLHFNHNINAQIHPLRFNHTLDYRNQSAAAEGERLTSGLSVSGRALGMRWRTRANYEYIPDSKLESTFLQLSRGIAKNVDASAEIEHRLDPRFTKGTLKANWTTEDFIVTPQVSLDSDNDLAAFISTRFGLTRDPRSGNIDMTKRRQGGNGSVSARVFLDKNGDGVLNEGEEPIADARVDSLQTRRYAMTDENGFAHLQGLTEFRPTDITLNEESLNDPYWISATPGVSVRPRSGHNVQVDFPVHLSGEIDGTVWVDDKRGQRRARNMTLILYDMDGRKAKTTQSAFDGFYLFDAVPPGEYYLSFSAEDIEALGVSSPPPEKVTIGYDGTVIYGKDYVLKGGGKGSASFTMVSGYEGYAQRHPHVVLPSMGENAVVLNLGSYKSQMMEALVWYRLKTRYASLFRGEQILVKPSQSLPDLEKEEYTLRVYLPGATVEEGMQKCRSLAGRGLSCGVELLPKGFQAASL
ncbi:MAG: hypothetical protein H6853_03035 [Rhodospirillales bacterium]|nr:hypothetical protein [Alphaproteobacteria bacterium]USO04258.1 MAG: hypothetical protein H6853_03035 [Rhodospirillales bacterium]